MTLGQWFGKWFGSWLGSGEPAPVGSMVGSATLSLGATGTLSAAASSNMAGTASFSLISTGTLTAYSPPIVTTVFQDAWGGAWGMAWGDAWGLTTALLETPYNDLSFKDQVFVRSALLSVYAQSVADRVVVCAMLNRLSILDAVAAVTVRQTEPSLLTSEVLQHVAAVEALKRACATERKARVTGQTKREAARTEDEPLSVFVREQQRSAIVYTAPRGVTVITKE